MNMTTHNAAREVAQAEPCPKSPQACNGCRDNFYLHELHYPDALHALDVFDGPAVRGQIDRRRACTACPDAAKPCLQARPADTAPAPAPTMPVLVLQAQDHTESLRTVLRACHAVASLAAGASNPGATVGMDGLGELLHLHSEAMEQRLDAIHNLTETIRATLVRRPERGQAISLVLNASDQLENMRQVQLAWQAIACMVPYAADTLTGENLGAALRLLADAMQERIAAMDDKFDALHAALAQQGPGA